MSTSEIMIITTIIILIITIFSTIEVQFVAILFVCECNVSILKIKN